MSPDFKFSDHLLVSIIMSAPSSSRQAVAVKGPRKREPSPSSSSRSDSFNGCRDSPSPTRGGGVRRATKSCKQYHRVFIETPPMHRHILEGHLETLWRTTGSQFKFARSSFAKSDMTFFEGFSPNGPSVPEVATGRVTRQVVRMPVPGSSVTGEANFRVTASRAPANQSQPGSSDQPGCPR